jgi:hypothetical protein
LYSKDSRTLGEGRGNAFIMFLKRERKEIAFKGWELQKSAGKLHARFDEGELEIEPRLLRQFPTLPISLLS